MPPTSNAGDHGPPTSQHSDNRQQQQQQQQQNSIQNFDQLQHNAIEPLAASSPLTKKGSFFKKNVEDGMDRVLEQVNFQEKFSSLPEFKPEEIQSPSAIGIPTAAGPSPHVSVTSGIHTSGISSSVQDYRKKSAQGPHRPSCKYR